MRHLLFCFILISCPLGATPAPHLTIAIVVDQMGWAYINKARPFLKGGLKKLLTKGVVYTEARFPHAITATGPGHTGLSTGTTAKDHGIVSNHWFDDTGKKRINFNSASQILVDGLSDQIVMSYENFAPVYALSLKERAAVAMASKLGKAMWFDDTAGKLTSSKEYFDDLPAWAQKFNKDFGPQAPTAWQWDLAFRADDDAYNFKYVYDTRYSRYNVTRTGDTIAIAFKPEHQGGTPEKPFRNFTRTPDGHKFLLDAAEACIDSHLEQHAGKNAMLWISLSGIDKLGHILGPDHIATMDMLYHLDNQLENFINNVQAKVGEGSALFMLTADHGTMSIVELLAEQGLNAYRVNVFDLMKKMNAAVQERHGVSDLVQSYKSEQFFFDRRVWRKLSKDERRDVLRTLKRQLRSTPGIREVWTPSQLRRLPVVPGTVEAAFREQLYRGRNGDIIVCVHPYVDLTKFPTGTGHTMPYNYNTHVPLAFYQPGLIEKKHIHRHVNMLQVAPTLARLLNVPRPSASRERTLPRLFKLYGRG